MAQFILPDIPGAVNRGVQFAQQERINPLQVDAANLAIQKQKQGLQFGQTQQRGLEQQIDQRTDAQRNKSLLNAALRIDSAATDADIIPILEAQVSEVTRLGGNPDTSLAALELARSGDFTGVRKGAKDLIDIGVRQGDISAPAQQKFNSLQQKVAAEGLDPNTPAGQARAKEITQGSRTDPSLKPSDQALLNKANEGQLASSVFANRVSAANDTLSTLEATKGFDPTSIQTALFEAIPGGNLALSDQEQQFAQAKRDFITAVLRKESGAAIGADEFANEDKKFFPQVGDGKAVLKQKAKGRERAFDSLKAQSKGVFDVQFGKKSGELTKAEQAELQQLRAELGQ